MVKKSLFLLFLFFAGVIGSYVYQAWLNKNNVYVIDMDGVLVKYAEPQKDVDSISQKEIDDAMSVYYKEYVKNQYCFAEFTLSGDWSDSCYTSKKECESDLKKAINDNMTVNTTKCYRVDLVKAWCLNAVRAGYYRYYFDGSYGEAYTTVCTQNKTLCDELAGYQHPLQKTGCVRGYALSRESLNPYVWKDKDIKELIEKNKNLPSLILKR